MKRTGKVVAWTCIFTTLFMGCYTSAMIDLKDDLWGRIPTDRIEWVATRGGTKYQFVAPPVFVKDTIVIRPTGDARDKKCLNEISYVITKNGTKYMFNEPPAIVNDTIVTKPAASEKEKISSGGIEHVVMKDGTKYVFNKAPAIVNDKLVGVAVFGREQDSTKQVSIPLSDVAEISVSENDQWRTALLLLPVSIVVVVGGFGWAIRSAFNR